jgi:hypothetical protein
MRQKVLATKAVYRAQTGIVVAEEIGDILKEFGVFDKVVAVTVDNAANMDVAIKRLQFVKLGCFAHSLNLAAQSLYSSSSVDCKDSCHHRLDEEVVHGEGGSTGKAGCPK